MNQLKNKCQSETKDFFDQARKCLCQSSEELSQAFAEFSVTMKNGVAFRTSTLFRQSLLRLAKKVVEVVGPRQIEIKDIQDVAIDTLSKIISENEGNEHDWATLFPDALFNNVLVTYQYCGPCELFRFEGVPVFLNGGPIKVCTAQEFILQSGIPTSGKDWNLIAKDGNWPDDSVNLSLDFSVHGIVWWIDTHASKASAPESARWLAEVFISAIRLGVRPADYCHRAKLGQVESGPFSKSFRISREIVYNERVFHTGGSSIIPSYKIDERFVEDFNSETFQGKLAQVMRPKKASLALRLSNGLGWLSRSRQAEDHATRLLLAFTALESLLSNQDQFQPVADGIARFSSVILSDEPESRIRTFDELKGLYALRSDLVHRGDRNIHALNANNVQYIAESVFSIVLAQSNLEQLHKEFLSSLRDASFGGSWTASAVGSATPPARVPS